MLKNVLTLLTAVVCFGLYVVRDVVATKDVNAGQYHFIANHLSEDECVRLSTALHSQAFKLSEKQKDDDISEEDATCLDLLLHWDRTPGEGKDKTQAELSHRLIQIGRMDLADWLTAAVFQSLSYDLLESLKFDIPVAQRPTNDSQSLLEPPPDVQIFVRRIPWKTHDTLALTACLMMLFYLAAISAKALTRAYNYRKWVRNRTQGCPFLE